MPAEFVPHSFPHVGTRLGESGADAFTIMKLMGDSSVTCRKNTYILHGKRWSAQWNGSKLSIKAGGRRSRLPTMFHLVQSCEIGAILVTN